MNLDLPPHISALREELQTFFAENLPASISEKTLNGQKVSKEEHQAWHRVLASKGYLGSSWPKEYGGAGWGSLERLIYDEESGLAGAPKANIPAFDLLAPCIIKFGTEKQKAKYLPPILNSDDWWCQGFSEPQAGSDLAALKMTAECDGDDYIVNGTKIWTSWAHMANKIFCLVRTSKEERKQAGISFLLIDMEQPGITVNPIITLGGLHAVNEVVITDVRVPKENLLGAEGDAWTITKYLLDHERLVGAWIGVNMALSRQLRALMSKPGPDGKRLSENGAFASRVAMVETDLTALRYTAYRVLADEMSGKSVGTVISVLKVRGGEIQQTLTRLLMEARGVESLANPLSLPEGLAGLPDDAAYMGQQFFDRRKLTIYGGSSEIQRNIIARQIVGK